MFCILSLRVAPTMSSSKRWEYKIVGDTTVPGGFVRLSKVAVNIVDTPYFQRLRYLKQLGVSDQVYPGATHTRFAHSLGVAHRARELLMVLQRRQPELGITDDDLQVVEVAGLCHDLGHGPFSHSFESELLPRILPGANWHHEHMSCTMFDLICHNYDVGLSAEQQQRVKDLIASGRRAPEADWEGKAFMFDIVANKRNGLDVDKFDYLRRDNMACGELTTSEFPALFESMRVIGGQICFKVTKRSVVLDVYSARARLHEEVYTHPVARAVELMVMDALALAADELGIPEALRDPERFALLDDTIVREVERSRSQSTGIKRAQQLLNKLRHRDIFKPCGCVSIPNDQVETFPELTEEELLRYQDESCGVHLAPTDIRVRNLRIDYTMRNNNPLEHVGFYENDDDETFFNLTDHPFAPGTYMTRQVRVYLVRQFEDTSDKERYMEAVTRTFQAWCSQKLEKSRWLSPQKSAVTVSDRRRALPSPPQLRQLPPPGLPLGPLPAGSSRPGSGQRDPASALGGVAATSAAVAELLARGGGGGGDAGPVSAAAPTAEQGGQGGAAVGTAQQQQQEDHEQPLQPLPAQQRRPADAGEGATGPPEEPRAKRRLLETTLPG